MPEDAYLPLSRLTETACRLAEMGKDSRLTPSAAQREDAVLLRRTAETVYDHGGTACSTPSSLRLNGRICCC